MKFSERLKALRESRSLTQVQIANITGLARSTISLYEAGKREPNLDTLKVLADYFNVDTDYLPGNASPSNSSTRSSFSKYRGSGNTFRIPVLGSVVADTPFEADQNIEEYEEIKSSMGDPRDYFALRVHEHSMEPRLMDGDTVIVKKQDNLVIGQVAVAVVLIPGSEGTVKQVRKTEKGILLIGFNQDSYIPQFYTNEEIQQLPIRIVGIVVESRHKWKTTLS